MVVEVRTLSGNLSYRNYITLTIFFQFYPDKTWKKFVTINMNNEKKNWKISETVKKIIILIFLLKIMVTNELR